MGFPDPALAAAVAMGESYGHSDASNIVPPSQATARGQLPEWSLGIWQINACTQWNGDACVSFRYDPASLLDPTTNAQVAYALSRGGADWRPWGAYTNGGYRQYLPSSYVPVPVPSPGSAPLPHPLSNQTVTPPQRHGDGGTVAAVFGALAVAAAAGYAAFRRREYAA